ncbi:hypothetical protein HDU82_002878, partial [Entophlyctis luteolus]
MRECARLCDNIAADKRVAERGLHGLVLTAGNFNFALSRRVTDEGLEQTFALNYLSKFLIINRLLPSLKKASGSVVSVLAGGNGGFFDKNDIQMSKNYNCVKQAIQTGVLVDLMTIHLASLYPESTEAPKFYHLFPGLMNTDNVRNANIPAFAAAPLKMFILPLVGRNPSAVAEEDVIPLLLGRSGEGGASGRRYYPSGGLFHPGLKGVPAYKELVDAETRTRLPCSSSALGSVSSIRRHKPEPVPASPGAGPDPDTSSEAPKNSTAGAASQLLSAHIDDLERKWEARRELQHQHLNKNSQPSANSAGNKTSTATTSTSTSIGKTRKFKNSYEAALFKRRSNKKKKKEKIQNTQKHASEEVGAQPPTVGLPVRSENPVDRFIANVILRRFDLAEEALLSVVNAGIPMSVGILNSKIEMLVYQGNLIAAFDVLEKEFEEHNLAPNGKSFEKLLVGCLTAIRYRRVPEKQRKHAFPTIPATEASQLTEELDRLAFVPSEAVINHPDRSEAYWTNRACLLLEKMIDSGFTPNLRIFDLFMRTFLLQGKYKRVFEMFKRMKDYDIKPDEIAYAI